MIGRNSFGAIVLGVMLAALPAFSQEGGRSEASVQAFGSFVKSTTDNGVQQDATNSGGVLASYRYFFSNSHGVEVNYGYSLNTQTYGLADGPLGVKSNQHEVTAAYVYRHALRHFTPFVEAGVGGLVFDPTDAPAASTQAASVASPAPNAFALPLVSDDDPCGPDLVLEGDTEFMNFIAATEGQLFVGGASDYEPRCRKCFVAGVVEAPNDAPTR